MINQSLDLSKMLFQVILYQIRIFLTKNCFLADDLLFFINFVQFFFHIRRIIITVYELMSKK